MKFGDLKKKYLAEDDSKVELEDPKEDRTLEEFLSTEEILNFDELMKFIESSEEPTIQKRKVMAYLQAFEAFFHEGQYAEMMVKGEEPRIDHTELEHGTKVELEHTSNQLIAQKIARDHLSEDSKYYIKLKRMEAAK